MIGAVHGASSEDLLEDADGGYCCTVCKGSIDLPLGGGPTARLAAGLRAIYEHKACLRRLRWRLELVPIESGPSERPARWGFMRRIDAGAILSSATIAVCMEGNVYGDGHGSLADLAKGMDVHAICDTSGKPREGKATIVLVDERARTITASRPWNQSIPAIGTADHLVVYEP